MLLPKVLIPDSQRQSVEGLRDRLDLGYKDPVSKRSGFVIMLVLSGMIAVAGVMADSTATVIGAMIIAPLGTPILGIGLGIVIGHRWLVIRSILWVLSSFGIVFVLGFLMSLIIIDPTSLATNSQISGRTSPDLLDLTAALATGTAGVFAVCRRDLSSIMPGVAIAISLVPPLGVAGVCAGQGDWGAMLGASVLFISNAVSLVVAASLILTLAGYAHDPGSSRTADRRRAYTIVFLLLLVVAVPLAINSTVTYFVNRWGSDIQAAATEWLKDVDGAEVQDVEWRGTSAVVTVTTEDGTVPDGKSLAEDLSDQLPDFVSVEVDAGVSVRYPIMPADDQ